jgi:hypothetical protein
MLKELVYTTLTLIHLTTGSLKLRSPTVIYITNFVLQVAPMPKELGYDPNLNPPS